MNIYILTVLVNDVPEILSAHVSEPAAKAEASAHFNGLIRWDNDAKDHYVVSRKDRTYQYVIDQTQLENDQ